MIPGVASPCIHNHKYALAHCEQVARAINYCIGITGLLEKIHSLLDSCTHYFEVKKVIVTHACNVALPIARQILCGIHNFRDL
jgi:hypothetical protein